MKVFVTRTVVVEVEDNGVASLPDAIAKFNDGKHITISASPNRPTHTPMGNRIQSAQPPTSIIPQPIPRKDWPLWAKALAQFSKPEDKGIGDVVARTIGAENSEAFKTWYKATLGKECGCNGRQKLWNIKYPLNLKAT